MLAAKWELFISSLGTCGLSLNASVSSTSSVLEEKCSQSEGPPEPSADAPVADNGGFVGSGSTGMGAGDDTPGDRATLVFVIGGVDCGKLNSAGG